MFIRIITAIILIIFTMLGVYAGGISFYILSFAVFILCALEYCRLYKRGVFYLGDFLILTLASLLLSINFFFTDLLTSLLYLTTLLISYPILIIIHKRYDFWIYGGLLYLTIPFILLLYYRSLPLIGYKLVLIIMIITWSTDTFAMLTGSLLKGPKLVPKLSKNKTWSGLIGSIIMSVIISTPIILYFFNQVGIIPAILWSTFISLSVNAGDLVESSIKRHVNAKNSSNFLPGHGGFLDRVDGLLFAIIFNYIPVQILLIQH